MFSKKSVYDMKSRAHAKLLAATGLVSSLAVAGSAMAADGVDVSAILAVIAAVVIAAGTIGSAVLAMVYGIKAYRWLRGAG